jgi:hypothetical protein
VAERRNHRLRLGLIKHCPVQDMPRSADLYVWWLSSTTGGNVMKRISNRVAVALLATITVAACGPSSPDTAAPAQGSARNAAAGIPAAVLDPAPMPVDTTADGLLAPIETATKESCLIDRQALQAAVDTYFAATGKFPANQLEMVDAGYYLKSSTLHDITPDGAVTDSALCQP